MGVKKNPSHFTLQKPGRALPACASSADVFDPWFGALSVPGNILLFSNEKPTNRAKEEKIQLPGCVPLLKMSVLELLI